MFHDSRDGRLRLIQQMHECTGDFPQVVRRHVGRQADRDTGSSIEQQVGEPCGQHYGLVEHAVKIGNPVDRALPQFLQETLRVGGEARFGVAHGRKGLWIVSRTPVALTIDDRVAVGEILRH